MKHIILLFFICTPALFYAQYPIDIKTKPLSIFLGTLNVSSEYYLKERISIEPDANFKLFPFSETFFFNNKGFILSLQGKFYFLPESKGEQIYIGSYIRYKSFTDFNRRPNPLNNQGTIGMLLGYKWVLYDKLILDVNGGLGRKIYEAEYINNLLQPNTTISNGLPNLFIGDGFFNCKVGYRFSQK